MDALKASIATGGFRSTIVVQKTKLGELVIRAGNGRHQAMKELGYEYIPALVYEEDDKEAIAYAIADNRTAELAEWDFEQLVSLLEDGAVNTDDLVGFEEHEVQNLLDADFSLSTDDTGDDEEDGGPTDPNTTLDDATLGTAGAKGRTVVFSHDEWEHIIEARAKLNPDRSIVDTLVALCKESV